VRRTIFTVYLALIFAGLGYFVLTGLLRM